MISSRCEKLCEGRNAGDRQDSQNRPILLGRVGKERLRTGHVGLAERTTFRLPLWLDRENLPKIGSIALWSNNARASVWALAFRWAIEQRKQPSLLKSYML